MGGTNVSCQLKFFNILFVNLTKKKVISIAIFELVIQFTFFLFLVKFGVKFITSGFLSLLSCLPEHNVPL